MCAISQLELDVLINPRPSLCVHTQHNSSERITKGRTSQQKAMKADKAISSDKKRLWIMCVRQAASAGIEEGGKGGEMGSMGGGGGD